MTTIQERQTRSIREVPKRRRRKAPAKGPLPRAGQNTRPGLETRQALVKRVRSYLDLNG